MTDQIPGAILTTQQLSPAYAELTAYEVTLLAEGSSIIAVTVEPSPTLLLEIPRSDLREPPVTVSLGQTTVVDNLIIGLETRKALEIVFSPLAATTWSTTNPSPSSAPLTATGSTGTTTLPRSTRTSRPNPSRNRKSKSGIGSGAIAGIAIAGIVILAVIIGGWYFWRRKKRRAQPPITTLTDDKLARREGDGDKMVLSAYQSPPTAGAYQTQYQEMSGNGLTQELDRSHSYKYAVGGAHELRTEDQPGELPYNGMEEHGRGNGTEVVGRDDGGDGSIAEMTPVPGANNSTSHVSPHVEAQRKREVEWLEMEETRMRQRREALLQQGGGHHT